MLRRSDLFGPILPSPFELKLNAERIRAKEIKNKIPRGYIATPGTGPKGETCRTCQHVVRVRLMGEQRLRCGLNQAKWKKTNRSRVIPTSPACSQWERGQEVYAKEAAHARQIVVTTSGITPIARASCPTAKTISTCSAASGRPAAPACCSSSSIPPAAQSIKTMS